MELRALKSRIAAASRHNRAASRPGRPEPVIPEIPPFTAPRTYALVDTVEGLDHWIEAAQQAGAVAVWPEASTVAGHPPGPVRDRAGSGARARRLCPARPSRAVGACPRPSR